MTKISEVIQKIPFSIESIIQGMPEISYVFSKEGKLLTWNKNMEIIFGYSNDELHHKFVSEFIYEADKERVVKKFMEILSDGDDTDKERTIEYRITTKSGKIIPILALRSLIVVDNEEYIMGIAIDISKLKNNKEKLDAHIAEIINYKNQLQVYYRKIEEMNQAEIQLKEKLFLNAKNFNNKLINSLPGIFYLYEKIDDKFFLKKWNHNYTTDLGYPEDEILNMQPHQFFSKDEYIKVEKAIMQIFVSGSTKIEAYTSHKDGSQIPYYYEGYFLEDKGKTYFMGVGIDVSDMYELKEQQKRDEEEKQKTKEILDRSEKELLITAIQIGTTNKTITNAVKDINEIIKKQKDPENCRGLVTVSNNLKAQINNQNNWKIFKIRFTKVHQHFFNNLETKHPTLSTSELKYCAFLRIRLSSTQIAYVRNVSGDAIKKTRYRIRKKLDLSPKESLESYIANF